MVGALRGNIRDIEAKTAEAQEKARQAEAAMREAEEASCRADRAKSEGMADAAQRLEVVAASLTEATQAITGRADGIRSRTGHQRDRIQETATAMEEMNATVLEVARNAGKAPARPRPPGQGPKGQEVVTVVPAMQSIQASPT
jgi:methyl-accepting chemotaxis protein